MPEIRIPSLETRWLKLPKWVSLPRIVVADTFEFPAACYVPEPKGLLIVDDHAYQLDRGLVVMQSWYAGEATETTLAHEMRHHWQHVVQGPSFGYLWDFNTTTIEDYKALIQDYYTVQPNELDALLFQLKMSPDWCAELWWGYILEKEPSLAGRRPPKKRHFLPHGFEPHRTQPYPVIGGTKCLTRRSARSKN